MEGNCKQNILMFLIVTFLVISVISSEQLRHLNFENTLTFSRSPAFLEVH